MNDRRARLNQDTVFVAVSPEREILRVRQRELNHFLWSTELAYAVCLTTDDVRLGNGDETTSVALRSLPTESWYPSNQGTVKYVATVNEFRGDLAANIATAFRAVCLIWYSHFEEYLEARVRAFSSRNRPWGPFTRSLAPSRLRAHPPLPLIEVLQADCCRELRNCMIHSPTSVPCSLDDPVVHEWVERRAREVRDLWGGTGDIALVEQAASHVVGHASDEMSKAFHHGKALPIEFFYMLFMFTNLDNLAYQIEEGLIPAGQIPAGRISRLRTRVRRLDLIIGAATQ